MNEFTHALYYRIALSVPIEDDGEFSRCIVYDVNFTAVLESGQRIRNTSWPVKKCDHGWTYDLTDIPYSTISTEVSRLTMQFQLMFLNVNVFYSLIGYVTKVSYRMLHNQFFTLAQ